MMNKSEIAIKLKSSIEDKLHSLGAYVDKELPEYILVMIANKKSKESMEKDLQLFLGQNTTNFIDWLHDLLEKCQENADSAFHSDKIKEKETATDLSCRKSPDKKKKKDKVKSKKTRKSDEKKEGRKSSVVKVHRSRSKSPRKSAVSNRQDDEPLKKVSPEKSSKKVNVETKTDDTRAIEKEQVPEKPQQVLSSIVKVTERPIPKVDVHKQSIIMIQRDFKEADESISRKRDLPPQTVQQQPEQRSSVFSRLGKTDLRSSNLSKKDESESHEKRTLKRTFGNSQSGSEDDIDVRYRSKIAKANDQKLTNTQFLDRDKPCEKEDDSNAWYRQARTIKSNKLKSLNRDEFMDEDDSDILPKHTKVVQTKEEKTTNSDTDDWPLSSQQKEEKMVNTNFIVTLKGAERLNMSLKARLGPKKSSNDHTPAEENEEAPKPNNLEPETIMEVSNDQVIVASQLSKCKFWPNCKNKESCPFVHPQECINFPNCKFGSACIYVHPDCRFGPNCSKSDCPFTHHQPKIMQSIMLPTAGLLARCLFYPNCTNVNCKFFHPNLPCKFALACKSKDTCMFYHPSIPHITELKWVASEHAIKSTAGSHKAEVQTA